MTSKTYPAANKCIFLLVMVFSLSACTPSTENENSSFLSPESSPAPTATPVPRWVAYETALADTILSDVHPPGSERLCEWDVWGHVGQEVYVWALCEVIWSDQVSEGGSVPAVIHLAPDGSIGKVVLARDGVNYGPDIKRLFPLDVQMRIRSRDFDVEAAEEHIALRCKDHSIPPMIAEAGTLLP